MNSLSILKNKKSILFPNSAFERRVILQYYLENNIDILEEEKVILNECVALESESIGIIGCLLNDKSHLNTLRLAIGVKNKSNIKLNILSNKLLDKNDIELADSFFLIEKGVDDLNEIEISVNKVYNMLYYS